MSQRPIKCLLSKLHLYAGRWFGALFVLLGWQFPLHSGQAFGVAGRIFFTVFGLMRLLFMLTVTLVWWKRRRGRK